MKEADAATNEARARYLRAIEELAAAREELRDRRSDAVWARLYPSETAGAAPPDTLAGAQKRVLTPLGVTAPVVPSRVLDALRADADFLATAATPEQNAAINDIDPRQPPNTEWANDPKVRAERDQQMADWAMRPGR